MEERKHFRVSADRLEAPTVIVVPSSSPPTKGFLIDMSASGAGVRMPPEHVSALAENERVVLVIGAHQLDPPITISATTTVRVDEEDGCRYGFQFVDPEDFIRQLSPSVYRLFDERHMPRVLPEGEAPVGVVVRVEGPEGVAAEVQGELNDISGDGVSVDISVDDADVVEKALHIELILRLPDDTEDMRLAGGIRHRLPLGDRWRFGFSFSAEDTADFASQQQRIVDYVTSRRREIEKAQGQT